MPLKKQIVYFTFLVAFTLITDSSVASKPEDSGSKSTNKVLIDSLFSASFEMIEIDNEIAKLYAEKGNALLQKVHYPEAKARYYLLLGRIAYYEDNYQKALSFLDSSKTLIDKELPTKELAQYYFFKSSVYSVTGSYQWALENLIESINVREKLEDITGIALCNQAIGHIYLNQNDLELAGNYFQKALEDNSEIGNEQGQINIFMSLGLLKERQDSLETAITYFNEAYEIALKSGDLRRMAAALYYIGHNQIKRGLHPEAVSQLKEAGDIYSKLGEKYGQASIYNLLSMAYLGTRNIQLSLDNANRAYTMAIQIESEPLLAGIMLQLSRIYKQNDQDTEALEWFEKYEELNSRLISWEHNKKISNLEFESRVRAREKDIEILNHKNSITRLRNILLVSFIVVGAIIASLLIISLRLKNKNLSQKQELLERKNQNFEIEREQHVQEKVTLENDLELQNKKLTTKALSLLHLNQTLADIGKRLERLKEKLPKYEAGIINEIEMEIRKVSHSNTWKEFDVAFNKVHNNFYEKLLEINPELSSAEIKTAAFLKLNLSTKEIASITYKSESAVKSLKHRLKAKLKLSDNDSLNSFLMKL